MRAPALALLAVAVAACSSVAVGEVRVEFFGESLCPYCAKYTVEVLAPVLLSDLAKEINFSYVPYGNARNYSGKVVCQHGPEECDLNGVFSCAIDQADNDPAAYFPFLYCVEANYGPTISLSIDGCADDTGLDPMQLAACQYGPRVKALQAAAAERTAALDPPHKYVPWVVVDGAPLGDDAYDLLYIICNKLSKDAKPSVCDKAAKATTSLRTAAALQACKRPIAESLTGLLWLMWKTVSGSLLAAADV